SRPRRFTLATPRIRPPRWKSSWTRSFDRPGNANRVARRRRYPNAAKPRYNDDDVVPHRGGVDMATQVVIPSINPTTEQVMQTFPEMTDAEVDQALARAQSAYEAWRTTSFAERAAT